ncbi:MAG: HD domain-containing protein [Chitinophagaceae bacterium]|nr:MAG: HD domain-containing protein [Chitinophagaceae bacterium]
MPHTEEILVKVAAFAGDAHSGQIRKYVNEPYVEHPVRVMYTCMQYGMPVQVLSAALLHDVIEDTKVDSHELFAFLRTLYSHEEAEIVLDLVIELTDVYVKSDYPFWDRRLRKAAELERMKSISPDAQTIKYADILDNSSAIAEADPKFAVVLMKEYRRQLEVLSSGNQALRTLARNNVDDVWTSLAKFTGKAPNDEWWLH